MKFKIGDRVKFKTWEQMEKEFGLRKSGCIDCNSTFVYDMKDYCGVSATIELINKDDQIWLKRFLKRRIRKRLDIYNRHGCIR